MTSVYNELAQQLLISAAGVILCFWAPNAVSQKIVNPTGVTFINLFIGQTLFCCEEGTKVY